MHSCTWLVIFLNSSFELEDMFVITRFMPHNSCLYFIVNIIPRMIMEWQQSTSCMYFGGAYKSVRMFDVSKECSVMDMPVGYDACVTSLNCDSLASHLLTAACSDGSIRVFDNRLPSDSRSVKCHSDSYLAHTDALLARKSIITSTNRHCCLLCTILFRG